MEKNKIKVLFTDLGGVLLTNGWDHQCRAKAVEVFGLDAKEYENRHQLLFGDYEVGKISLETYLHYAVFFQPRKFTPKEFMNFMYSQSQPLPDMIALVKEIKVKYGLKLVVISNEGRELTDYRIKAFDMKSYVDFFIVSAFIGMRKPDREVYRLALDLVQVPAEECAYLEDRELFVEIAKEFGIHAIHHKTAAATKEQLMQLL